MYILMQSPELSFTIVATMILSMYGSGVAE